MAAGKAIAAKNKQAREAQKKALAEAQIILANNQLKKDAPVADPPPSDTPATVESTKNVLTTTQWLSVISILVSLAGIYYKRKEIKSLLTTKKAPQDVDNTPPAPPPSPVDVAPKRKGGIHLMD